MIAIVYGPNLGDQSRGTFHVHADGCGHQAPTELFGDPAPGWAITVDSRAQVALEVYGDQIREGASYESCRTDIWFAVCCHALPEGDAEALLAEFFDEEHRGMDDHFQAELDVAMEHQPIDGDEDSMPSGGLADLDAAREGLAEVATRLGEFSALMATGMEATCNAYLECLASIDATVQAAAHQARVITGPSTPTGSRGVSMGDMPEHLWLEDTRWHQRVADVTQAAAEYGLYHRMFDTCLSLVSQVGRVGEQLGMGRQVGDQFRASHRAMRVQLEREGFTPSAMGGGSDA